MEKSRKSEQIYVFYQLESPWYHPASKVEGSDNNLRIYENFFNKTMTYRFDSDYIQSYSNIMLIKFRAFYENQGQDAKMPSLPLKTTLADEKINNFYETFSKSTLKVGNPNRKGILSVVSNCRSRYRNLVISSLDEYFRSVTGVDKKIVKNPLEVFGKCASKLQKKDLDQEQAGPSISKKHTNNDKKLLQKINEYKFYLSIENSNCKDYITEKFFENALATGAVPVVAGADRSSYEKIAPASSFIHVDDFESIGKLGEYLGGGCFIWRNFFLKNLFLKKFTPPTNSQTQSPKPS